MIAQGPYLSASPSKFRRFFSPQPVRPVVIDMFDFQPKINKNTEKLIKNRDKKLEENKSFKNLTPITSQEPLKMRASEKILIIKFNKEFDKIKDEIIKLHKETLPVMEFTTSFNYEMIIRVMVRMGFLQDSLNPGSSEHVLAQQIFIILGGAQFSS
jgi:hypothetical protein